MQRDKKIQFKISFYSLNLPDVRKMKMCNMFKKQYTVNNTMPFVPPTPKGTSFRRLKADVNWLFPETNAQTA